ncbi:hypothetical protein A2U01_0053847, partial [Trifolium medium]|nr:hypothetical protein [Trifolium medium]
MRLPPFAVICDVAPCLSHEPDGLALDQEYQHACLSSLLSDTDMAEYTKAAMVEKSTADFGWDAVDKSIAADDWNTVVKSTADADSDLH